MSPPAEKRVGEEGREEIEVREGSEAGRLPSQSRQSKKKKKKESSTGRNRIAGFLAKQSPRKICFDPGPDGGQL